MRGLVGIVGVVVVVDGVGGCVVAGAVEGGWGGKVIGCGKVSVVLFLRGIWKGQGGGRRSWRS